ncbi:hypothetical protein F2Q69_00035610 [Brassica cretica]|uniref:Uncharacterized protein n=1 Tax=Brassica cretica TaxID=69181 RepID=A0A8S9SHQ7_BRACR|nr:hypothetical protein F2Q69_00035610 [Brassica cretica]
MVSSEALQSCICSQDLVLAGPSSPASHQQNHRELYQISASGRINKWGMSTPMRPPQRVHRVDLEQRAPRRRRMETLSQAGDLRTWSLQWMNVTTRFMEVLKNFINRRQWSPNTMGWGMKPVSTAVPRPKKEAEPCRRRRNPPARTLVPKASQTLRIT